MADKFPSKGVGQTKETNGTNTRSFMHNDFPFIRRASVILLCCIAAGAVIVGSSTFFLKQQIAAKDAAQPLENQTREKLHQAEIEKQEIYEYQPKYKQLIGKGFVGDEKRLDWMENIKHIQERHRLPPITYEISSQQAFVMDSTIDTGTLELHGSRIRIKMHLLHELDFLNFINDLKIVHSYSLNNCNIKRTNVNLEDKREPRLYTECELFWITLGRRAGAEAEEASSQAVQQGK
jgi:hypothetical protein